jgi:hypothetical protein
MGAKPPNLRLHLEQRNGVLRTAAQVAFGADGSLYLVPYAPNGIYWYGETQIPTGQSSFDIPFKEHVAASARPKLSVHWSGDVHIYANDSPKAGPVSSIRLGDTRGEHIASVQFDHVEQMPIYLRTPRTSGETMDVAFGLPDDVRAGKLLIYANGERNLFRTGHVHFAERVERDDGATVWFGFLASASDPLGQPGEGGVSVLAGFDARKGEDEEQQLLFLRGA